MATSCKNGKGVFSFPSSPLGLPKGLQTSAELVWVPATGFYRQRSCGLRRATGVLGDEDAFWSQRREDIADARTELEKREAFTSHLVEVGRELLIW